MKRIVTGARSWRVALAVALIAVVAAGRVTVTYRGWLTNGTEFDSGQFDFLLGNDEVIPGFEGCILGMRVGGTRRLVIPPNRAYGSRASGPIPAGAVLVFEITADALN
jgi:FKBP-type peptidyl-prolyl cis-trans isomerase FkpA